MSKQDLHERQTAGIDFLFDFLGITAGIDQCGQTRLLTPD